MGYQFTSSLYTEKDNKGPRAGTIGAYAEQYRFLVYLKNQQTKKDMLRNCNEPSIAEVHAMNMTSIRQEALVSTASAGYPSVYSQTL